MSAYHVADATGMIKLDAMENPYSLPESLLSEWAERVKSVDINRYPDPGAEQLKQVMRDQLRLPQNTGLILGNGSDEIIQMLAMAFGGAGRSFMSMEPTFVMYRMIAAMNGLEYINVELNTDDFSFDMEKTIQLIEKHQPAVVFIANPNNPTGNIHSMDELRKIAAVCPGVLIIDEAYAPFTDMTAEPLLEEFSNVLIMRTVSKMGLAGLRLGYLIGDEQWIAELDKVRLPYNINVLTQAAAIFALENRGIFDDQARLLRRDREAMLTSLSENPHVHAWPSEANFILFKIVDSKLSATEVFESLKSQGVLIKNLSNGHSALQNCLRVTVGTTEENACFLEALNSIL